MAGPRRPWPLSTAPGGSFTSAVSARPSARPLRLGFIVAPPAPAGRFGEVAACLAPPPGPAVQLAVAEFMREGHYLRHLRRAKRVYVAQRDGMLQSLKATPCTASVAGLGVLLRFPDGTPDLAIAREAAAFGMSPSPLSGWYASPALAPSGLLLGLTTAPPRQIERSCERLNDLIGRFL